jgi:hypothetical protein
MLAQILLNGQVAEEEKKAIEKEDIKILIVTKRDDIKSEFSQSESGDKSARIEEESFVESAR